MRKAATGSRMEEPPPAPGSRANGTASCPHQAPGPAARTDTRQAGASPAGPAARLGRPSPPGRPGVRAGLRHTGAPGSARQLPGRTATPGFHTLAQVKLRQLQPLLAGPGATGETQGLLRPQGGPADGGGPRPVRACCPHSRRVLQRRTERADTGKGGRLRGPLLRTPPAGKKGSRRARPPPPALPPPAPAWSPQRRAAYRPGAAGRSPSREPRARQDRDASQRRRAGRRTRGASVGSTCAGRGV